MPNWVPIRACHCKLCEHKRGVVTPLHPWAFEEWARKTDREQRMARYNMTVEAKAEMMMRRLIDR
jgi:hypothetical protein